MELEKSQEGELNESLPEKLVTDSGRRLAVQLMLRAIFLKLNSPQAHEALLSQLCEQVDEVKHILLSTIIKQTEQVLSSVEELSCQDDQKAKLDSLIDAEVDKIISSSKEYIKTTFSKPSDVAGLL